MSSPSPRTRERQPPAIIRERLAGIVERVTFQCPRTGWTVLKVAPFDAPHTRVTVTLHHLAVFAGATMEFHGNWGRHAKHGEQFECQEAVERKPASAAALERYLGSGLIRGVGPAIARKVVRHFGAETLRVFEEEIGRLVEVRGIAERKLESIRASWSEHRMIRDVMLFLQEHGVSTLFAVRIYKQYGNAAIAVVQADPYRLARDIYGIGFFSADRIALALGFAADGPRRIEAGIRHVLSASREAGHCYLRREQVVEQCVALLEPEHVEPVQMRAAALLDGLVAAREVAVRHLDRPRGPGDGVTTDAATASGRFTAYYAPSLFRAEESVARAVASRIGQRPDVDTARIRKWLGAQTRRSALELSDEQRAAIEGIATERFSVLTGGPGCGKTTALRTLVQLLDAMGRRVVLAAPTGRAAQRMSEVIGAEAKTAHRLLEWDPVRAGFRRDANNLLPADFLVVDETSMLDILITAALLDAVPQAAQVLFIGDPHQLPSVGPGAVLADLLAAPAVPRFALTKVFRQAATSDIIRFAHAIDGGQTPNPISPIADPGVWTRGTDCLFLDAEEATGAELAFVRRAKRVIAATIAGAASTTVTSDGAIVGELVRTDDAGQRGVRFDKQASTEATTAQPEFSIPKRFLHVDLEALSRTSTGLQELQTVLRRLHPHSTLHHGLSLTAAVARLYTKTIPAHLGAATEIQILSPMNRGSVGADALNTAIQTAVNPARDDLAELRFGQRILRTGDRVIQRRNDYDLGVFNGDIGRIVGVDPLGPAVDVAFASAGLPDREVRYDRQALSDLGLAYAITIHKSQGSEFAAVIIPLCTQHYSMLFRDLVYTGLTRARKLAIFVGSRAALGLAVANVDARQRQTALTAVLADLPSGVAHAIVDREQTRLDARTSW